MIKVITDTGADLSPEILSTHDISFLPIPITIDGQVFLDRVTVKPSEFFQKLPQLQAAPETVRIAPGVFEKAFSEHLRKYNELICITFSSTLSAIHEAAVLAAEAVDPRKISVIDSESVSLGQGLLVLKAVEMVKAGQTRQAIVEYITTLSKSMEQIVACGSFEMLKRSGRVTTAEAFALPMTKAIPIFQMEEGKLLPLEMIKGPKRVIRFMMEVLARRAHRLDDQIIGISHANNPEIAQHLAQAIRDSFAVKDILIAEIGAAIGSHVGPNTLALFFRRNCRNFYW